MSSTNVHSNPYLCGGDTRGINPKQGIEIPPKASGRGPSRLNAPPWHAYPIEYPKGATSTMDKITHSTTIIIKLFLLSFNVLLTL